MSGKGDSEGHGGRQRRGTPGRLVAFVVIAAAIGGATAVVTERTVRRRVSDGRSTVLAALDGRRVSNGRLTGGAPYAEYSGPIRATTRGAAPAATGGAARASSVASVLADGVEHPSGASLRDVGVVRLALGQYRLACASLERARALDPGNARIAADLAVALLEEAAAEDVPQLAASALATADEAIALDANVDEAWFTRAAALEHLWIGPAAVQAWYDYLGRDEVSPWGIEARRRVCLLERLADPAVRAERRRQLGEALESGDSGVAKDVATAAPSIARRAALDLLERDWPEAIARGDEREAAKIVDDAGLLANALAVAIDDRFVADAVEAVSRCSADPVLSGRLAAALRGCARGRDELKTSKVEAAEAAFRTARSEFGAADCEPFAMSARVELARCLVMRATYSEALDEIEPNVTQSSDLGYRHMAAVGRWIAAYVHAASYRPRQAISQFDLALAGLEATGDDDSASTVAFLLAESSAWFGRGDESWRLTVRALERAWRAGRAGGAALEYSAIARRWEADGDFAAARVMGESSIAMGRASGNHVALAGACASQAGRLARSGDRAAALSHIEQARREVEQLPDGDFRHRIELEIDAADAEVRIADAGSDSAELLSEVLDRYATTGDRVRTVTCLRLRSAAYAAASDDARALSDLELARDELLTQRSRLRSEGQDSPLAYEAGMVLDLLTERYLGDPAASDRAFVSAETKRSWTGLNWTQDVPASPGVLAESLGATEAVAVFALLPNELVAWSITSEGSQLARVPGSSTVLRENIRRFERAVESGSGDELGALSDPLVEALWRPIESAIGKDVTVTIIGGEDLDGFPMGALLDSRAGEFLIARNAFASSISVAHFKRFLDARDGIGGPPRGPVLVVGDPAFDSARYPDLQRLPGAAAEARSVAATYENATCLTGEGATRGAIEQRIPGAAVVHYAGHAVENLESTREGALVLAPSGSGSDVLRASEVQRIPRIRARLVVIAACSSAASETAEPGSSSLARAFVDAGAQEVVGCHWAVDDSVSARLLPSLHQRFRNGVSVPQALRQSVLQEFRSFEGQAVAPRNWAAFTVVR